MPNDQTIALGVKPPEGPQSALNALNSYSQYQNSQKDLETKEYNLRSDQLARAANEVMQAPEGSQERVDLWNHNVKQLHQRGYLNNVEADHFLRSGPSTVALNQAIARGTKVSEHQAMTGATAGKEAAARAPYEFHTYDAANPAGYFGNPAAPGAPSQAGVGQVTGPGGAGGGNLPAGPVAPPAGPLSRAPVPSTPQVWGDREAQNAGLYPKPGESPDGPSHARVAAVAPAPVAPAGPVAAGPAAGPTPNSVVGSRTVPTNTATPATKGEYYDKAPTLPVAPPMNKGPGTVNAGIAPAARQAGMDALKKFSDDVEPSGVQAQKNIATLGTMESYLESGKFDTNKLADIKLAVGGLINAFGGQEMAKKLTGSDLPTGEALTKEMQRMGLTWERQTLGAREAFQAIQTALQANPQMLTSTDGNLKILKTLRAAAQFDATRSQAAKEYYQKQLDTTGAGHLTGFDQWFSQNYSPATFISKAAPYQPPKDGKFQDGITYTFPTGQKDAKGNPVMGSGTYDAKGDRFVH